MLKDMHRSIDEDDEFLDVRRAEHACVGLRGCVGTTDEDFYAAAATVSATIGAELMECTSVPS